MRIRCSVSFLGYENHGRGLRVGPMYPGSMFADRSAAEKGRILLGVLLAFLALNAWAGGFYAMSGAPGVPVEWLSGSPFEDYFVPGLVLFFGLGGTFLLASLAVFTNWRFAPHVAGLSAALLVAWLVVQVWIIGIVSFMQPVTAFVAFVVAVMAWALPRDGASRWLLGPA